MVSAGVLYRPVKIKDCVNIIQSFSAVYTSLLRVPHTSMNCYSKTWACRTRGHSVWNQPIFDKFPRWPSQIFVIFGTYVDQRRMRWYAKFQLLIRICFRILLCFMGGGSVDVAGQVHFLAFLNVSISAAILCRPVKFSIQYHYLMKNQDIQLALLYLT